MVVGGHSPRPLVELLSDALLALTREFEEAGAGDDPPPSLVLWSGLLRAVTPEPILQRDLVREVRLSRRAVQAWLGAARQWGYVEVAESGIPRAGNVVQLTDKGRAAHDEWAGVEAAADKAWRNRVGAAAAKELRGAAGDLVSRIGLELPHYPVGYGSADWSMTGGNSRPAKSGPPRIPAHGADWSPVVRAEGDTVSHLPDSALLSQALTWFQIDGQSAGCYPQIVIDVLRRIPKSGVPMKEQPPLAGCTGDGRSGFERHGVLQVKPDRTGGPRVHLTALAQRVLNAYEPGAAEVERRWREEYGAEVLDRLRAALEAVATKLGPSADPPHHLWVVWQGGFGFVEATQRKRP